MPRKPWESSPLLEAADGAKPIPFGIDGILQTIAEIEVAEEWRCKRWKKQYPDHASEIDAAMAARIKPLESVRDRLHQLQFENDIEQEQLASEFIWMGMLVYQSIFSWLAPAAEDGLSQEKGRINSRDKRKSEWKAKQRKARLALELIECDPEYENKLLTVKKTAAAESLGISLRAFQKWLAAGN